MSDAEVRLLFSLALAGILAAAAAFLAFAPPPTLAKRLLALWMALNAAMQFTALGPFVGPPAGPGFDAWDTRVLRVLFAAATLVAIAFQWHYPRRPAPRSAAWWLALAGAGSIATGPLAALALFPWTHQPRLTEPFGTEPTALGAALAAPLALGWVLMIGSVLLRARDEPPAARAGIGLVAFGYAATGVTLVGLLLLRAAARGLVLGGPLLPPSIGALPWPEEGAVAAGWVLGIAGNLALAAAWRRWAGVDVFLVGIAFGAVVLGPLSYTQADFFFLTTIAQPLFTLYAIARHGALGTRIEAPGTANLLAGVGGLALFLCAVSVAFSVGQDPLVLAVAVGVGIAMGLAAAVALHPRLLALLLAPAGAQGAQGGPGGQGGGAAPWAQAPGHAAGAADPQRVLGRYRVLRPLGQGGAGRTRLAHDERVGRDVVLKTLHTGGSAERLAAIVREARAVGRVSHPNIVTLYDVQEQDGEAVIVMEHAGGGSLKDRLALHGRLGAAEFAQVAAGLLRALEAVHAAGILHRDVKPANVLLDARGNPKLADFGIAKLAGVETTAGSLADAAAVGTFRYMSPEQARGRPATQRSDLFSAGATLYEALAGQPYLPAAPGDSAVEVQLRAAGARPFDRPVEPPALRAWFARMLDPDPEGRFASAGEALAALEATLGRGKE